jgi:ferritin-like metal-binding protein YciE
MALDSMYELLMAELQEMYHAENLLLQALPRMAAAARASALRRAFQDHLIQTEDQVSRLEQVFGELGVAPRGRRCKGMEGLVEEGKDLMEESGNDAVLDAGLISVAQRIEHYEMASYASIVAFAELLGEAQVVTLLRRSMQEEKAADEALGRIADAEVYSMAVAAGMEEE